MPFDIPIYHIFKIADKVKAGQDITYDDLAKLYGTPTYQLVKYLDNFGTLSTVFEHGNRYIDRTPYSIRAKTDQTRFGYSPYRRKWHKLQRKRFASRKRNFSKSRSIFRSSKFRKRWSRYSYPSQNYDGFMG